MTTLDQVPFGNMEFADNPEPRCPCLLLLDTSESMRGDKIRARLLAQGIATAADIDRKQPDVPHLVGRSAAEGLLAWYRMHLRSYEGPVGTPTADEISAVDDRFDYLEDRLLKRLGEGAAELQRRQAQILTSRARLASPLQVACDALSRAQLEQ